MKKLTTTKIIMKLSDDYYHFLLSSELRLWLSMLITVTPIEFADWKYVSLIICRTEIWFIYFTGIWNITSRNLLFQEFDLFVIITTSYHYDHCNHQHQIETWTAKVIFSCLSKVDKEFPKLITWWLSTMIKLFILSGDNNDHHQLDSR